MKNREIISSVEVPRYIERLWATPLFRMAQLRRGTVVQKLVERLSRAPLIVYEMDRPEIEAHHFTLWFNHLAKRNYDNPYIQDLYYFHELVHLATMWSEPEQNWRDRLHENELLASLVSEVFVYFWLPGLREKSFGEEIWADSWRITWDRLASIGKIPNAEGFPLLAGFDVCRERDYLDLSAQPLFFQRVTERRQALRAGAQPLSEPERWITKFNWLKDDWFDCWEPYALLIDAAMRRYRMELKVSEDLATKNLCDFVDAHTKNDIPFEDVALATKLLGA